MWNYVSDLGVVSTRPDSVFENLILEMERRDKEGLKGMEELKNGLT